MGINIEILEEKIKLLLKQALKRSVTLIPNDIKNFFKELEKQETNEISKNQINLILENFKYGKEKSIPLCQDTGVLNFYIKLGNHFPIISNYSGILIKVEKK